jgi:hypothetical protein
VHKKYRPGIKECNKSGYNAISNVCRKHRYVNRERNNNVLRKYKPALKERSNKSVYNAISKGLRKRKCVSKEFNRNAYSNNVLRKCRRKELNRNGYNVISNALSR